MSRPVSSAQDQQDAAGAVVEPAPSRSRGRTKTLVALASAVQRSRAVLTVTSGSEVGRVISLVQVKLPWAVRKSARCGFTTRACPEFTRRSSMPFRSTC